MPNFLIEHRLSEYEEALAELEIFTFQDMLLSTEDKFLEVMKKGHVRRLLSAMEPYKKNWDKVAAGTVFGEEMRDPDMASIAPALPENDKTTPAWKTGLDMMKTGRRYYYCKATNERTWYAPNGWISPRVSSEDKISLDTTECNDENISHDGPVFMGEMADKDLSAFNSALDSIPWKSPIKESLLIHGVDQNPSNVPELTPREALYTPRTPRELRKTSA